MGKVNTRHLRDGVSSRMREKIKVMTIPGDMISISRFSPSTYKIKEQRAFTSLGLCLKKKSPRHATTGNPCMG